MTARVFIGIVGLTGGLVIVIGSLIPGSWSLAWLGMVIVLTGWALHAAPRGDAPRSDDASTPPEG